jgi:hypothetical protein
LAKPKIQTRFIETLIETMTKMRKYFIHAFVVILCSVRANEVLLVDVATMPNNATRIVCRLMVLRFSSLIVSTWSPNPSETI